MKPGFKTTEFWLAILTPIVAGFLPADFPKEALVVIIAYILSRGLTKLRAPGP